MRYFSDLTGKLTKLLLFTLSVGLLFSLTSCLTLRETVPPPTPTVPAAETEKTEPDAPKHDFRPPETEETAEAEKTEEPAVYPEYERTVTAEALGWIDWYEGTYGKGSADNVLLNRTEIENLNRKMCGDTPNMRDMSALPQTMSGQEVLDLIHRYELPADERYVDGHTLITSAMREDVRNNRALDQVPETVGLRYGIVTQRSNLKGFPTDKTFHKSGDPHYDGIQETELIATFPVAVLHTSGDGNFVFVLSYFYSGWVPVWDIAFCSEEDYRLFVSPADYVTVLSKTVECAGTRLDMGAVLPFVSEDADSFTVQIPKREDGTGQLILEEAVISKADAVRGSLEFTVKNYYRQAFLYLGTYYGWGGSSGGVDCSGFVCAVFRSFGIYLPRNTGEQSRYAGTLLSLADDPSGVLDTIRKPAAVYRPGHVMLYLGKQNGKHYIIHAPQGGEQVCVAELSMAKLTGVSVFG